MGKQFHVYLLPTDAVNLVAHLKNKVDMRLLSSRSDGPEPVEIETPVRSQGGFSRIDCLLVPNVSAEIKMDHIEAQGYWNVDTLSSEVIEFSGCHFDGNTLKRGRFFYGPGFYKSEHWQEKSPCFLKWTDSVFRNAKKFLKRLPGLDAYLGADAEFWRSKGGVFVALAIKGQPPIIAK
jgi:hypothetical protein